MELQFVECPAREQSSGRSVCQKKTSDSLRDFKVVLYPWTTCVGPFRRMILSRFQGWPIPRGTVSHPHLRQFTEKRKGSRVWGQTTLIAPTPFSGQDHNKTTKKSQHRHYHKITRNHDTHRGRRSNVSKQKKCV